MNTLKGSFGKGFKKFASYYNITPYMGHPELKITERPTSRLQLLITMRDLRLWVNDYAPWNSRSRKLYNETEMLNRELNYLQFFGKDIA
jgi:hypothetical protein